MNKHNLSLELKANSQERIIAAELAKNHTHQTVLAAALKSCGIF